MLKCDKNGDNEIQNFHLWKNIVGCMPGNNILRSHSRITMTFNFQPKQQGHIKNCKLACTSIKYSNQIALYGQPRVQFTSGGKLRL